MSTTIPMNAATLTNAAALLNAAETGDLATVHALIAQNPRIAGPRTRDGNRNTALMLAASNGHLECVKALLLPTAGRWIDDRGMTALALAALFGHAQVVELLLPMSNPNHINQDGETALMHAAREGQLECLKLLAGVSDHALKNKRGYTALVVAIEANKAASVELLMVHTDLNVADENRTPLMWAVYFRHIECVRVLRPLSDIGVTDDYFFNAVWHAGNVSLEVLDLLLPGSGNEPLRSYRLEQVASRLHAWGDHDRAEYIETSYARWEQRQLRESCDLVVDPKQLQTTPSRRL